MKIILIRHGDAGAYTHPDSERHLSELGKYQAEQTAHWLTDYGKTYGLPTLFVSSPYHRAKQTCDIIRQPFIDAFAQIKAPLQIMDNITPNDDAKVALQTLCDVFGTSESEQMIVVVCHMPIVAKLVALLTGDTPVSYALAEARVIDTPLLVEGLGKQTDAFIPKQA